jgi:hypothetical protein
MDSRRFTWVVVGTLTLGGCNLDKVNPNAPTQSDVLTTREGIIALSVGVQARYAAGMADLVYPSGVLTDELAATIGALQGYRDPEVGIVQNTYATATDLWSSHYRTIKSANDLIVNAPHVSLSDSTLSGILVLSYLLKAASLGELLQGYQQIAINTYNVAQPTFVARTTALASVLDLLDSARTQYAALRPGAEFNGSMLATGFDLSNTISAMQARYQRLGDNWAAALSASSAVNPNVLSTMPFSDQATNPIVGLAIYVRPRDAFRLSAAPADTNRIKYHITVDPTVGFYQPLDLYRRYTTASAAIPLYYPDEMRLIRAEALTELGQLPEAQAVLDSVRTDCGGGGTADEPHACLAPLGSALTQDSLRAEIYYQRKYELFATGLRWEDARRLGLVGATSVAKRCWLLYPLVESNVNPNAPPGPELTDPPAFPATCF